LHPWMLVVDTTKILSSLSGGKISGLLITTTI